MAEVTDVTLKGYFEAGDQPTQQQFYDLIDSKMNVADAPTFQLGLGWENVRAPGHNADGTGLVDDTAAFADTILDAGAAGTTYVPDGTYWLKDDLVFGNTILSSGAILKLQSGITIRFNGAFSAPPTQHFTGTGLAVFGTGSVLEIIPDWWETFHDGVVGHSDGAAILKAIASTRNITNIPVQLLAKDYWIDSPIVYDSVELRGIGYNNNYFLRALDSFSGAAAIQVGTGAQAGYLRDVAFDGRFATATVPIGIYVTNGVGQLGYLQNVLVFDVSGIGIKIDWGGSFELNNIWTNHTNDDGILITYKSTASNQFASGINLYDITAHAFAAGKVGVHIKGDVGAISTSRQVRNITLNGLHLEVMNGGTGLHVESALNVKASNIYYFGSEGTGDLVKLSGLASDTFNVKVENLSKPQGALTNLINDTVSAVTVTDNSCESYTLGNPQITGRVVQGSDRRTTWVIEKTGLASATATALFTITTKDESGSQDGGTYICNMHAAVSHQGTSGNGDGVVKNWQGAFSRAIGAAGAGTNSAVENIFSGTSAATTSGNRDVSTITVDVVETSEYVQTVRFAVTLTGSGGSPLANVAVWAEILWSGFKSAPAIAAA